MSHKSRELEGQQALAGGLQDATILLDPSPRCHARNLQVLQAFLRVRQLTRVAQ
jgi:hypothetical protein